MKYINNKILKTSVKLTQISFHSHFNIPRLNVHMFKPVFPKVIIALKLPKSWFSPVWQGKDLSPQLATAVLLQTQQVHHLIH